MVPLIEVAIAENALYTTQTEVDWTQEAPTDATLSHTLHAPETATSLGSEQTCCTSVSWSSTGETDPTVAHQISSVQCLGGYVTCLMLMSIINLGTAVVCVTQCMFAGQGIAVTYGRFDVEGWCLQPGRLCTWNLARTGFDPNKPEVTVEVDSCLQCCAYHPQQPVCSCLLVFANAIFLSHTIVSNISVGNSICLSVWQHGMHHFQELEQDC